MNYVTNIMGNISVKKLFVLTAVFFIAITVINVPSAKASYTPRQIADALTAVVNAGWTASQIAAAAQSLGITKTQLGTAAQIAYPEKSTTMISNAVNQAYASVVTIRVPATGTTVQGTTYYAGVESGKSGNSVIIYANGATAVGNLNTSTGLVTTTSGSTVGNIASFTGVSVSATVVGGQTVTTTMDSTNHSFSYQAGMMSAGYQYLNAVNNGDTAGMAAAVQLANNTLNTASNGGQTAITVVQNTSGTVSYGCVNAQNTTLSCPAGTSFTNTGTCVAKCDGFSPQPASCTPTGGSCNGFSPQPSWCTGGGTTNPGPSCSSTGVFGCTSGTSGNNVYTASTNTWTWKCTTTSGYFNNTVTCYAVSSIPTPTPTTQTTPTGNGGVSGNSPSVGTCNRGEAYINGKCTPCNRGGCTGGPGSRIYPNGPPSSSLSCKNGTIDPINCVTSPAPTVSILAERIDPNTIIRQSPALRIQVKSGDSAKITWSTTNVTSCTVSGPNNFSSTALSSSGSSVKIDTEAKFTITCTGKDGSTKSASTTVAIKATDFGMF